MKYDAVVVLSSNYPDKKELTQITISRLEKCLELYYFGWTKTIALSGSSSNKMCESLSLACVNPKNIFQEEYSRDTVGNAVFSKLFLAIPNRWKNFAIVSSDFHIPRIERIFQFVYGKDFEFDFISAKFNGNNDFQNHERESLEVFHRTFKEIKEGDDMEIINRLFDAHESYRNLKDKNQLRSMLMGAL